MGSVWIRAAHVWSSAADGVHCLDPDGTLIGKIRIPELVSNVCFGGPEAQPAVHHRRGKSLYSVFRRCQRSGSRMSAKPLNIAFLGIGLMGFPMARNLLTGGFDVTAWNRSADKAHGAGGYWRRGCSLSAAEAVRDADVVITMLSDGPAVADMLFAQQLWRSRCGAGRVFIDMSSIKPGRGAQSCCRAWRNLASPRWMRRYPAAPRARTLARWRSWRAAARRHLQ